MILSACGGDTQGESVRAEGSLNVAVTSALGNFDHVEAIRLSIVETDAAGNEVAGPWTYSRDLQRNGNVWTTSVGGIPLGHFRVTAEARNASKAVLFTGTDRVHVESDDNFQMTIIMQEEFDDTLENQSPLFVSVIANKANVNHDETLEIRVGATDPDGNEGLTMVDGVADGSEGNTVYFKRVWSPQPTDDGETDILLELVDRDENRSAMSITVNVGGTGSVDATMIVNLAPHITGLTSTYTGGTNNAGHFHSTQLSLEVFDGDYYNGSKGETNKRQDDLTYAWSIVDTAACQGSFNGNENGTFDLVEIGTSNGAKSVSVTGTRDVIFTLNSITNAADCWLQVEVTDQWLGKATALVQVDTSRVQPFFVPNLQLSIQSHDAIENPSGFTDFDKLQFEVYADGVPDGQDAHIDWAWSIGGTPIIHYEAATADALLDALEDWLGVATVQDIDLFGAWLGMNCDINDFPCFMAHVFQPDTPAISAVAGSSWDTTDARAYSELRWWTWQKYPCFQDGSDVYTTVEVTASANGVSDTIAFDVAVDLADVSNACSSVTVVP